MNEGSAWYVAGRYPGKDETQKAKEMLRHAISVTRMYNISIYAVCNILDEAYYVIVVCDGVPPVYLRDSIARTFKQTRGEEHTFKPEEMRPLLQRHLDAFASGKEVLPDTLFSKKWSEIED